MQNVVSCRAQKQNGLKRLHTLLMSAVTSEYTANCTLLLPYCGLFQRDEVICFVQALFIRKQSCICSCVFFYIHCRDYVTRSLCLSVCFSVCLFVSELNNSKIMNRFRWNFVEGLRNWLDRKCLNYICWGLKTTTTSVIIFGRSFRAFCWLLVGSSILCSYFCW